MKLTTQIEIDSAVEAEFTRLAAQWRERKPYSIGDEIILHPAYQRIIGMGPVVIPLILKELATQPDHWFWALQCISGEDPVEPDDYGRIDRMAGAWLRWGQSKGYDI